MFESSLIFVCLVLPGLIWTPVYGEYYSSIDKMQLLGQVEGELVSATDDYLMKGQKQLDMLRR